MIETHEDNGRFQRVVNITCANAKESRHDHEGIIC